jgi:hypothetical protein
MIEGKETPVEDDKMQRGFKRLHEMKSSKKTGKVIFYLDGTGKVRDVEAIEKV